MAAALETEVLSRLDNMLEKEFSGVAWKEESWVLIFEPLLAAMLQPPPAVGPTAAVGQAGATVGPARAAVGTAGAAALHPLVLRGADVAAAGAGAAGGQPQQAGASLGGHLQVEGASSAVGGETASSRPRSQRSRRTPDRLSAADQTTTSTSRSVRADYALVAGEEALQQQQQQLHERMSSGAKASTSSHPNIEWQESIRKFVAVAEVKRYAKLFKDGLPLSLVDLCSAAGDGDELAESARHIINQLFTYMVVTGVQFGWLSCYCATWLAWRPLDQPDHLFLSKPFLHSVDATSAPGGAVTKLAALSWLQDVAMSAWLRGHRHQLSMHLFAPSADDGHPGTSSPEPGDDSSDSDFNPSKK